MLINFIIGILLASSIYYLASSIYYLRLAKKYKNDNQNRE